MADTIEWCYATRNQPIQIKKNDLCTYGIVILRATKLTVTMVVVVLLFEELSCYLL